ncbi:MAG: polyamine aminopropyltransferase [Chloroflexi bacterium]|nr:polyamine aminopropyltransferase [Chloroflexota bacterium]
MAAAEWWHERLYPSVAQSLLLTPIFKTRSQYQDVVIAEHDQLGRVLILDGIVQITEGDASVYQEMMAHVPIMGLDSPPGSVLIVGGGDGAIAREVLRHRDVQRTVMVELDQAVIDACKHYMPSLVCDYSDPRLELAVEDAAEYVKQAPDNSFDVAIVDSPDPIGPAEVLFGEEFYSQLSRVLTDRGVAVFQSGVPQFQRDETARVVARLRHSFPQVTVYQAAVPTYYGGSMALSLASNSTRPFDQPRAEFSGRYYNAAIHKAAFALPTWWLEEILQGSSPAH